MDDFDRIFGERLKRAVKAISLLETGARYEPSAQQKLDLFEALEVVMQNLREIYGVKMTVTPEPEPEPEPEPAPAPTPTPAEGWKHYDIPKNVNSIPDNQLGSYATRIMARLCERFDT